MKLGLGNPYTLLSHDHYSSRTDEFRKLLLFQVMYLSRGILYFSLYEPQWLNWTTKTEFMAWPPGMDSNDISLWQTILLCSMVSMAWMQMLVPIRAKPIASVAEGWVNLYVNTTD